MAACSLCSHVCSCHADSQQLNCASCLCRVTAAHFGDLLLPFQTAGGGLQLVPLTMRVLGSSACSTVALSLLSPALTLAAAALALLTFRVLATPADNFIPAKLSRGSSLTHMRLLSFCMLFWFGCRADLLAPGCWCCCCCLAAAAFGRYADWCWNETEEWPIAMWPACDVMSWPGRQVVAAAFPWQTHTMQVDSQTWNSISSCTT